MLAMNRIRKTIARRPSLLAFVVLMFITPLLSACEDDGLAELVAEMALEWAQEKKLVSISADGDVSPNYIQIGLYEGSRALNTIGGGEYTTGDKALDAALDVAAVGKSIRDADKLAAEGMKSDDPAKLDQAIAARPQDWNYQDQKAAVLAANGDSQGANDAISQSENIVAQRVAEEGNCRGIKQNMLRGREQALEQQLVDDPQNQVLLNLLARTRAELFALNNNEAGSPCP